jgi:hypothetical protein
LGKLRDPSGVLCRVPAFLLYHVSRNFKSTHRNTRARSYVYTVSYVMEVGAAGCCL